VVGYPVAAHRALGRDLDGVHVSDDVRDDERVPNAHEVLGGLAEARPVGRLVGGTERVQFDIDALPTDDCADCGPPLARRPRSLVESLDGL